MGNGEVFYGKRRYKPSGNVQSDYRGCGLSDRQQIDEARAFRDERSLMRELAREQNKQ